MKRLENVTSLDVLGNELTSPDLDRINKSEKLKKELDSFSYFLRLIGNNLDLLEAAHALGIKNIETLHDALITVFSGEHQGKYKNTSDKRVAELKEKLTNFASHNLINALNVIRESNVSSFIKIQELVEHFESLAALESAWAEYEEETISLMTSEWEKTFQTDEYAINIPKAPEEKKSAQSVARNIGQRSSRYEQSILTLSENIDMALEEIPDTVVTKKLVLDALKLLASTAPIYDRDDLTAKLGIDWNQITPIVAHLAHCSKNNILYMRQYAQENFKKTHREGDSLNLDREPMQHDESKFSYRDTEEIVINHH